jgi:hypothetical protein
MFLLTASFAAVAINCFGGTAPVSSGMLPRDIADAP